jgi:hypothetical protein
LKFFLLMLATSCRTCAKTTCPKLTTMLALQRACVTASSAPLRAQRLKRLWCELRPAVHLSTPTSAPRPVPALIPLPGGQRPPARTRPRARYCRSPPARSAIRPNATL